MDTLGRPYRSENPTDSGVLDTDKLRNDAMMYSDNVSSIKLRDAKGLNVESDLQLL